MVKHMRTFLPVFLVLPVFLAGQNFEGKMFFSKESPKDTSFYCYNWKDHFLRLDEFTESGRLKSYVIFNFSDKTVTAVSPAQKLCMRIPEKDITIPVKNNDIEIIHSGNHKNILGYECYQYRIKHKKANTEIAYWLADLEIEYFKEFLKMSGRVEKSAGYYFLLPDGDGRFPLLSTERNIFRDIRLRLRVTAIEKQHLSADLFSIPEGYHFFQEK